MDSLQQHEKRKIILEEGFKNLKNNLEYPNISNF